MNAVGAVIICILSALGLSAFIWSIVGAFFLPIRSSDECRIHIILNAKGSGGGLQHQITSLDWITDAGFLEFDTVILDSGLDEEARSIAETLTRRDNVSLCEPSDLFYMLTEK